MKKLWVAAIAVALLSGCMTAAQHREAVQDNAADRMTVGKVQREIRVGMSGAEVAQVLGSPNIVSTDEQRREVWIYDKIATDTAYSTSSGGVAALILGAGGAIGGGAASGYSRGSGASSKSQRTLTVIIKFDENKLTVIIKFDENKKVRDFAYHTSRF